MSMATTLPRKLARRSGASTFSQTSFVSSGAGPRSGSEAGAGAGSGVSLSLVATVPQAVSPNSEQSKNSKSLFHHQSP